MGIPVYLIIFIVCQIYLIGLAWDAVSPFVWSCIVTASGNSFLLGTHAKYDSSDRLYPVQPLLLCLCCIPIPADINCTRRRQGLRSSLGSSRCLFTMVNYTSTHSERGHHWRLWINILLSGRTTISRIRVRKNLISITLTLYVLALCVTVTHAFWSVCAYRWRIYKKIGADPEIRSESSSYAITRCKRKFLPAATLDMYRWYQILLTILKIDMFFFLGYSIQYLVLVLHAGDVEFPLTIIALPLTFLFLLLAVYAVNANSFLLSTTYSHLL